VLHGGFGFSSHTHGLAVDWIDGVTVVLANGTAVNASETENQDLFWALRGSGSNFGIVSSFRFKTFAAPPNVTAFNVNLAWRNASNIVKGWTDLQDWLEAGLMPEEMNMRLLGNSWQTQLQGLYHGNESTLRTAIKPLLETLNATVSGVREYDWMGGIEHYAYSPEIDITRPHEQV
jgi:FAD/FMN-containing dehydrogenase